MQSREATLQSPVWRGRENELCPVGNPKASDSANLDSVAEVRIPFFTQFMPLWRLLVTCFVSNFRYYPIFNYQYQACTKSVWFWMPHLLKDALTPFTHQACECASSLHLLQLLDVRYNSIWLIVSATLQLDTEIAKMIQNLKKKKSLLKQALLHLVQQISGTGILYDRYYNSQFSLACFTVQNVGFIFFFYYRYC